MYHRVRKKMSRIFISAIFLLVQIINTSPKPLETTTTITITKDEGFDNNIIDFDEEYTVKFNKKYGTVSWHGNDFNRNTHRYTIIKDTNKNYKSNLRYNTNNNRNISYLGEEAMKEDVRVIPLELKSTTKKIFVSVAESTTEPDLTVIPLSTTHNVFSIKTEQTVTLPTTTEFDTTTEIYKTSTEFDNIAEIDETSTEFDTTTNIYEPTTEITDKEQTSTVTDPNEDSSTTWEPMNLKAYYQNTTNVHNKTKFANVTIPKVKRNEIYMEQVTTHLNITEISNSTDKVEIKKSNLESEEVETDVPIFTELDTEDLENIPEDYYDYTDVLPTSAPKTDAISVLFGLAGSVVESVVESVAEKVVPKTIYDLFKRMQRQNEALEAERLRSREENGGLGQFGRGILKSLSTGLTKPLSHLMAEVKEVGSLDTDRGFVASVATSVASSVTSVANVANNYLEAFKDKVQAIYPGTVWCGDGHSAQARSSSDLGLFFFTDTCCREHDACKIYIKAGESKYGLNNTGLFTRSHCSCDASFRACLHRTNSLVSAQIGLTYFNVLSPQCFRRAHPIVKCVKRTRITGQKCEEYELDYTKPRMWQWFDNETF